MLSQNDVIYAYRMLLGREPESDAVIKRYAAEVSDLSQLRRIFMESAEFRDKSQAWLSGQPSKTVLPGKRMDVEVTSSPDQMQQLFERTAQQWLDLGKTEPYWSVVTNNSYRMEQVATHMDTFYATGESEVNQFALALSRANLKLDDMQACLELGCGVGRVTAALAKRFSRVVGVDISQAHLSLARQRAMDQNWPAIQWHQLCQVDELSKLGRFDAVYSQLVLQHNPPPVMLKLLVDLLWMLNPGGVAYIQIPTYKAGYSFSVKRHLHESTPANMDMHFLPQSVVLDAVARCQCAVLEIREDDAIGRSALSVSNTFLVRKAQF